MDNYGIDSHKLSFHPARLAEYLEKKDVYPIYIEIAPAGTCNHRCIFCALDYLKYRPHILKTRVIKKFICDIGKKGIKSVMYAGEGEPLLHPDIAEIVNFTKKQKIDVAITTNGVLLNKNILKQLLKNLSWLRVSINASNPKAYSQIHRTNARDFTTVISNLKEAVKIKRKKCSKCTLGAQFLLLHNNYEQAQPLARLLKNIGIDYLIIKPYSQHPLSLNRLKDKLDYKRLLRLEQKLKKLSDKEFKVIFRRHTMDKLNQQKPYKRCLGFPFWAYLDSQGNLYACSSFLGDKRFSYGNIYKESFEKIWKGKARKRIKKMLAGWNTLNCREVCRLDEINRHLWKITHPPAHVNFI
ncbi:MAG: radical SAM protein [Candidatus Omnitrophica bacterium]|nr:radical SAM protein [Candidatus Omnitrophota bacterium]